MTLHHWLVQSGTDKHVKGGRRLILNHHEASGAEKSHQNLRKKNRQTVITRV